VVGVDVIRYRPDGDIGEIRVLMRPLSAIGAFASAIGPAFARRLSPSAGVLIRLLSAPLNSRSLTE